MNDPSQNRSLSPDERRKTQRAATFVSVPRFFLRVFWVFFLLRVVAVLLHYLGPSPWGGPLVLSPDRFIPEALLIEGGIWGLFVCCGLAIEAGVFAFFKSGLAKRTFRGAFLTLAAVGGIFSQVDFEVTRWLGQHMSASYIANFAGARDGQLFARILAGDLLFSSLAFVQMVAVVVAAVWLWMRAAADPNLDVAIPPRRALAFVALTAVALASPFWLRPSEKRWRRVMPASIGIAQEAFGALVGAGAPKDVVRARQDLLDFVVTGSLEQNVRPKNKDYPLFRDDNVGDLTLEVFRALPLAKKPDVIFIVFETMRGANTGLVGDPHSPLSAMPRLREQITQGSYYFPRVHSAGYPSVGGAMGMHLGIWPHHTKIVFSSFLHIRSLSFPEILRSAGYESFALLGADPSFSNFTPWFRRWYDQIEYEPSRHHDGPLVDRFIEVYDERQGSPQPLLMTLWTATTHPPYDVPKESGVTPASTNEERYLQAMRYADEQLDRLLRHVQASPRYAHTLVFLIGDHSQPTPWAWRNADQVGELSSGHTWTSLAIFGGAQVAPTPARDERVISHIDLAPTIVAALNLKHGNHFFGRDVLNDKSERSVHSFRYGTISEESGSSRSIFRVDGEETLSYSFDREDERSYGSLEGGRRHPASPLPHLERTRDMARAWGQMLEQDQLIPPGAVEAK